MPQFEQPHKHSESPHTAPTDSLSVDGIDLTLIRWMLSLTPSERLSTLQQAVNSLARLSNGRFAS